MNTNSICTSLHAAYVKSEALISGSRTASTVWQTWYQHSQILHIIDLCCALCDQPCAQITFPDREPFCLDPDNQFLWYVYAQPSASFASGWGIQNNTWVSDVACSFAGEGCEHAEHPGTDTAEWGYDYTKNLFCTVTYPMVRLKRNRPAIYLCVIYLPPFYKRIWGAFTPSWIL